MFAEDAGRIEDSVRRSRRVEDADGSRFSIENGEVTVTKRCDVGNVSDAQLRAVDDDFRR